KSLTNNLGQISVHTKKEFEYHWGRNAEEFVEIVSMPVKSLQKVKQKKKEFFKIHRIRKSKTEK
ncbi:unnamed protein product, partial [marine sediment metagenome]